jgi:hypothetical protein
MKNLSQGLTNEPASTPFGNNQPEYEMNFCITSTYLLRYPSKSKYLKTVLLFKVIENETTTLTPVEETTNEVNLFN